MLIVIVHGLGSNPDKVRYLGKALVRRLGGRYICPSYFWLPTPGQNRFAFNTQMSDVRKQVEDAREGREPLVMVGHSYGGFIVSNLSKSLQGKYFSINSPFLTHGAVTIKHSDDVLMRDTRNVSEVHVMHPKGKGPHFACITCYNFIELN